MMKTLKDWASGVGLVLAVLVLVAVGGVLVSVTFLALMGAFIVAAVIDGVSRVCASVGSASRDETDHRHRRDNEDNDR